MNDSSDTRNPDNKCHRIKRVTPIQLGKVLAIVSFAMSLIFTPIMVLVAARGDANAPAAIFLIITMPVMNTIVSFIVGMLGAVVYNYTVKYSGGIELELEKVSANESVT